MFPKLSKVIGTFVLGAQKTGKVLQPSSVGEGPLYNRHYEIEFYDPKISPHEIMEAFKKNPNLLNPPIFNHFEKIKGLKTKMKVGDEFISHLIGPWNSPTRVMTQSIKGFKFETLDGSMEAGTIEFNLSKKGLGWVFYIESQAKSRDSLINFLYDKTPFLKLGQKMMWIYVCKQFAQKCQAKVLSEVSVVTKKKVKNKWIIQS